MVVRKRMLALLLTMLMALSLLAGCGQNNNNTQQNDTGTTNGEDGGTASDTSSFPNSTDNPNVTVHASEPPSGLSVTAVPDTLTVAQGGERITIYPQEGNQLPSIIAMRPMYETLINYNPFTDEYEPRLAERWEMVDDETIRLYLRQGVYCHAGYEMTAEDVLWTAQRGQEESVAAFCWSAFDLSRSKVVDTYTVDLVTFGPFGPILDYLSNTSVGYIVNKQAYEEQSPEDYARNPTGGTGPYKFVEWIAGDRVVYERNEEYWGEKPYFKNLVIRNIADDVTRALSLESGEVDMIYGVDTASYQTLLDSPTTNLITFPSYQRIHLGLNNTIEPFNDPRVRKAIWYALDLDSMVNLAFSGQAEVADGCWPNSLTVYEPAEGDLAHVYDVNKAKELLKEAGWENGFTFDLWVAETTAWVQMAEMIQNALAEINITAKVQVMDQNTLLTKRAEGTYEAYIARFSSSSGDGDWWYNRLFSEGSWQENVMQYKNDQVDEWLTTARYSLDSDLRNECYLNILEQWRKDLPWISLACPQMTYGIRSTLDGMEPHGYGIGDLRYIHPISGE